jgi:hypothetical protein
MTDKITETDEEFDIIEGTPPEDDAAAPKCLSRGRFGTLDRPHTIGTRSCTQSPIQ